jgi:hypothetical protein
MSTITFRESLKYGGRLFALWFAVTLVGGGLTVLGGYLAVPEVRTLIASGTSAVETATLAGGIVLAFLGFSSLLVGNFALGYKFLGDSVSKGIRAASPETLDGVVDVGSEASSESTDSTPEPPESPEPAPAGESTEQPEPTPAASDGDVQGPAAVPASEQPTAETVRQPARHEGGQPTPAQEGTAESAASDQSAVADEPVQTDREPATESAPPTASAGETTAQEEPAGDQEPAPEQDRPGTDGRERTAEEIAFGADGPDGASEESRDVQETTGVTDDEWFDEEPQESETDRGAEIFEEEPAKEVDRSNVETANDSSADPLSDQFEE